MYIELIILLVILLIASVIHQKFEKKKDRNIKEELRETLNFTEQKKEELLKTLNFTEQRYKASMEFNSYFLNNGSSGSIAIGMDSKHYILYNNAGQAVIEESEEKFSKPEKTFYSMRGTESEINIH